LVNACHKGGLAVIFDVVYNHITDDADSSFRHFDERSDGTGDSYLGTHPTYHTDWGTAPAFWRQGIRDFFVENMGMYLSEYRGDGLRFDSTRTMERTTGEGNDGWEFMQHLTFQAKKRFPGKYLIAEHLPDDESILFSGGFHAQWTLEPFYRMISALEGNDPVDNIEGLIGNSFGPRRNYPYSWNTVTYLLGSHDECGDNNEGQKQGNHRHYVQRFGGRGNWFARAKTRMAWSLNVAMKGTPMLFMGSECHLDGYWHDGGDKYGDHRFNWNIAGDAEGISMRRLVGAANDTRRSHSALRNGNLMVTHRDRSGGVIAFKRWNDNGDVILVVVNCSDQTYDNHSYGVATEQRGRWQQILCSQDASFGGWDGAGNAYHEPTTKDDGHIYINVPKWSVTMFRLT
jgi:1,4-alpha-glucan branching enzyme